MQIQGDEPRRRPAQVFVFDLKIQLKKSQLCKLLYHCIILK